LGKISSSCWKRLAHEGGVEVKGRIHCFHGRRTQLRWIFYVANCVEVLLDCPCQENQISYGKNSGSDDTFHCQRYQGVFERMACGRRKWMEVCSNTCCSYEVPMVEPFDILRGFTDRVYENLYCTQYWTQFLQDYNTRV
jgi:hypothetical protein